MAVANNTSVTPTTELTTSSSVVTTAAPQEAKTAEDVISALKSCLEQVQQLNQPDLSVPLTSDVAGKLASEYSQEFELTDEAVRSCIARIGVWLEESSQGEEAEGVAEMLEDLKKESQTLADHHANVVKLTRGVSDLREMELLRDQLSERLVQVFDAAGGCSNLSGVTQEELDVIQTEAGDLQTIINRVESAGFQPDSIAVRLLRRCDDLLSLSSSGILLQSQQSVIVTQAKDDSMFLSALSVQTVSRSAAFGTPQSGSTDIAENDTFITAPPEVNSFLSTVEDAKQRVTAIRRSLSKADHEATVDLLEKEFSNTCDSQLANLESNVDKVIENLEKQDVEKVNGLIEGLRLETAALKRAFEERKTDIQLVDRIEDRFEAARRDIEVILSRQKVRPVFADCQSLFGLALCGLDAEISACMETCKLSESSEDSPLASRTSRLQERMLWNLQRLRSFEAKREFDKEDIDKCLLEGENLGDHEWYSRAEILLKWAQQSPIASEEVQQIQEAVLALNDERLAFAKQLDAWIERVRPEILESGVGGVDISSLLNEIDRKKRRLSIIEDLEKQEECRKRLNELRNDVVTSAGQEIQRWLGVIEELVAAGRVRIGDQQMVVDEIDKLASLVVDFDDKQQLLKQIIDDCSNDQLTIQSESSLCTPFVLDFPLFSYSYTCCTWVIRTQMR